MISLIKRTVAHSSDGPGGRGGGVRKLHSSGALTLEKTTGAVVDLCLLRRGGNGGTTATTTIVSASTDGTMRVWNASTGGLMSQSPTDGEGTTRLAYANAGAALATSGTNGNVYVRDGASGAVTRRYTAGMDCVSALCVLGDAGDGEIVAGDDRGRMFAWMREDEYPHWRFGDEAGEGGRVGSGQPPVSPSGRGKTKKRALEAVNAVCGWRHASSGEEFVASGSEDGTLRIWRARVSKPVAEFGAADGGHRGAIHAMVDSDGVIVTTGVDGRVLAWYVNENGDLLGPPEELNVGGKHAGAVLSAIRVSKGIVCTGGVDQKAMIWDVKHRLLLFECAGSRVGSVQSLLYDDEAGVLYTGCASAQILRWELPKEELADKALRDWDDEPLLTRRPSTEDFDNWDVDLPAMPGETAPSSSPAPKSGSSSSSTATAQMDEMRRRMSELEGECESLRAKEKAHAKETLALQKVVDSKTKELERAMQDTKKMVAGRETNQQQDAWREKSEKMETIARKQKAKLDEIKSALKAAEEKHRVMETEKDAMIEELSKEMAALKERAENSSARAESAELSVEEMMQAAEKALLSPEPSTADNSSQDIMRELHSVREELQLAKQDANLSEISLAKLREECTELRSRAESLEGDLQRATDENDALTARSSEQSEQHEALKLEADSLRSENAAQRERIEQMTSEVESAVNNAEENDAQTSKREEEIRSLRAKIDGYKKKLDNAVKKGKGFEQEAKSLRNELAEKQAEMDNLRESRESLKSELSSASGATVKSLNDQLEQANGRVKELEREIASVKSSVSSFKQQTETTEAELNEVRDELRIARQAQSDADAAKEESAKSASLISELREQLTKEKRKFDNAVKKGKSFQEQAAQLTERLDEAESELTDALGAKIELEQRLDATREEIARVREEYETHAQNAELLHSNANEELRKKLEDAQNQLAETKATLESSVSEVAELKADVSNRNDERQRLIEQIHSSEQAQMELQKLRENIATYETEMQTLKTGIETAKNKFTNAVKKGKGFQEEANRLRREVEEKSSEINHLLSGKNSSATQTAELVAALETSQNKLSELSLSAEAQQKELDTLRRELATSRDECSKLQSELEQREASSQIPQASRGEQWLEQQARATAEAQARDLSEENERLRQEVAAASAAAQEAWQVAASHGIRPGDSRPASEIGSPIREGYQQRARSLYQHPSHRGAMSMIYDRAELSVSKEEHDRVKEVCSKLKRELAKTKTAAKEAMQQVINRLEIEVVEKVHAQASAKAAEAESARAWAHAKDALATTREVQKAMATTKLLSPDAIKPQPPIGTLARDAMDRKSLASDGAIVVRQEHLLAIFMAFVAFIVGSLLNKS